MSKILTMVFEISSCIACPKNSKQHQKKASDRRCRVNGKLISENIKSGEFPEWCPLPEKPA